MNEFETIEKFSIKVDKEIEDLRDLKFNLFDENNEKFMEVVEDEDQHNCCWKQMCCLSRPFVLNVLDTSETKLMEIHRPYRGCVVGCGLHEFHLNGPSETEVGLIHQRFCLVASCGVTTFLVKDESDGTVFRVRRQKNGGFNIEDKNGTAATIEPNTDEGDDENEEPTCQVCAEFSSPLPTLNVEFSVDMDLTGKQLVLASALFIYITEIDRRTDTISKDKGRCCCFCFLCCLCLKGIWKAIGKVFQLLDRFCDYLEDKEEDAAE